MCRACKASQGPQGTCEGRCSCLGGDHKSECCCQRLHSSTARAQTGRGWLCEYTIKPSPLTVTRCTLVVCLFGCPPLTLPARGLPAAVTWTWRAESAVRPVSEPTLDAPPVACPLSTSSICSLGSPTSVESSVLPTSTWVAMIIVQAAHTSSTSTN